MSAIFKFLFEIATDPLGLPIDWWQEYIILAFVGEFAYQIAYAKVGQLYDYGVITTRTSGSFLHWLIRLPIYVAMWAVTYGVIWLGKFVIAHWVIIALSSITLFILYLSVYNIISYLDKGGETNA